MKKLLVLFLLPICLSSFTNTKDTKDFLDYWRISYNENLIRETYMIEVQEISINTKDIKPTDSLVIEYFRDTPCYKCECYVFIENKKKQTITEGEAITTGTPIKISLLEILHYYSKTKEKHYKIIYTENNKYWQNTRILLFKLKLE